MCVCVQVTCVTVHVSVCGMYAGAHRSQKRVTDALELKLQTDVCRPTWMLRTKFRSLAEHKCS